MIDLEKEEFLQRLDIRLVAISGMLAYHENHIMSILCDRKGAREMRQHIEQVRNEFCEYILKTDKEIQANFERLKQANFERLKKEIGEENEGDKGN